MGSQEYQANVYSSQAILKTSAALIVPAQDNLTPTPAAVHHSSYEDLKVREARAPEYHFQAKLANRPGETLAELGNKVRKPKSAMSPRGKVSGSAATGDLNLDLKVTS